MNSKLTKFALTLALALATTLTLTACEEKKKQDGTTPEPAAATETQQPSQEAAADTKPPETASESIKSVKIGTQVWMAENLNIETEENIEIGTGKNFCYDNEPANCQKYGRLYDWNAALKACPSGWHLPSKAEWDVLITTVGGNKTAGKYLNAKSGWDDYEGKSLNGEDKFGFSALPGGEGNGLGDADFFGIGSTGTWWTSSEGDSDNFDAFCTSSNYAGFNTHGCGYSDLLSVRCIQN
jgi:uncharacterized protein (TIGR02145 family)